MEYFVYSILSIYFTKKIYIWKKILFELMLELAFFLNGSRKKLKKYKFKEFNGISKAYCGS